MPSIPRLIAVSIFELEVADSAKLMTHHNTGIKLANRAQMLKTYFNCFVGE
jgi:hypothetical protein